MLFALIAKQEAFHQLRSVEQLDYISFLIQRIMSALMDAELEKMHNLNEESGYYWSDISCGTLRFDMKECEGD
ncbi:Insulin-degrading enzyme-like 1, peroxisomal [Linum grandiflorum]